MSGFSREFMSFVNQTDAKTLEQRIVSGGQVQKYLGEGDHDVRVAGIDRNKLTENKLTVKWETTDGKEHRDMMFVMEQDRKTGKWDLNWRFARLLGALIPSTEAYDAFFAEVSKGNADVLDSLVGMHCRLSLKRGKGYGPYEVQPTGGYVVRDTVTGDVAGAGGTIDEAVAQAEARGFKKAYINASGYAATHGEANINAFALSLAAVQQPKVSTNPFAKVAIPF